MNKSLGFIFGNILIASILGIWGQSIAYGLHDLFGQIDAFRYLAVATIVSIVMFIANPLFIFRFILREKITPKTGVISVIVTVLFGIPISVSALFILAMWWS